ncbi:DUF4190 domain-containing protein [Streptomyces sp. SDr-06]|uniref:DUF4190 domain-containing protein n=1 Tax=Streptomyces sp. SDr-06 TaxID=2267702 RepID=UPI000DEBAFDB|nr:DUF4190 domain-containing protein [Streptomyces sp. SDr-06]RCH66931.1 DUF4190 domain-containing protein [Streptomyces sp. SDr-06]
MELTAIRRRTRPHALKEQGGPPSRDADGMAIAAFVLGLLGLLVMNVVLGPIAIVLSSLSLLYGTKRRGRAFLGLALGVADLVVLVALVMADHTVSWGLGG